jgi:hypothetical protein
MNARRPKNNALAEPSSFDHRPHTPTAEETDIND